MRKLTLLLIVETRFLENYYMEKRNRGRVMGRAGIEPATN